MFEFDPFCLKTNETPETFRIAVVFLTRNDGVDHLAGHKAIVAGAIDHFDFAHAVNKFIKDASAEATDRRFAFAGDAASGGAVVAFFDTLDHFGEEAGRILAIGIHRRDIIASCVFEAGEEGGLFSEIAGKGHEADAGVGSS